MPEPLPPGYNSRILEQALKLYLEGNGLRRTGRLLSVNHQSVANRVNAAQTQLRAGEEPVELFVRCGNQRQSYQQQHPRHPSNIIDFVSGLI